MYDNQVISKGVNTTCATDAQSAPSQHRVLFFCNGMNKTGTRIRRCVSPPWANFSCSISPQVGIVSVPELSEEVSFGTGTLLDVEQSGMENRFRGV